MSWREYAASVLAFSAVSMLVLYALKRLQHWLPLNPQHLGPVPPHLAFNTAASFTTNTNWQSYVAETTMSYLTQMAGLTLPQLPLGGGGNRHRHRGHPRARRRASRGPSATSG